MNVLKREFCVQIIKYDSRDIPEIVFYKSGNKNAVIKAVKQFMNNLIPYDRKKVLDALTNTTTTTIKTINAARFKTVDDTYGWYVINATYSVMSVEKPQFNEQGEDVEEKRKNQVLAQKNSLTRLRNEVDFYSIIITELLRKDIIHKIVSGIRINGQNRIVTPSYVFVEKAGISFMFNVMSKNGDIDTFLEKVVDTENDNDFRCTCYKKSFNELSKLMHDLEDISKRVRIAVEKESVSNA